MERPAKPDQAFYLHPDHNLPDNVASELTAPGPPVQDGQAVRSIANDIATSVLAGVISAGIWDYFPQLATHLRKSPKANPLTADEVMEKVAEVATSAGLAANVSEVRILRLEIGRRQIWEGRVEASGRCLDFRSDSSGNIVHFTEG